MNQRFNFDVPETAGEDLTVCYRSLVEQRGRAFALTPDTARVLRSATSWLREGKSGLMLAGSVGTGKSILLNALSLLFSYYTGHQTIHLFNATEACNMARSRNDENEEKINHLKTFKYIGIDDLGIEPLVVKNWGSEVSPIIDALYHRYDNMMVTVITTNATLDDIRERYGPRLHDRIMEQYDCIVFNFNSFRTKTKKQ